jgi:predicted nucleic acid-binding protein
LSEKRRLARETLDRLLRETDGEESVLVEIPFDRNVARMLANIERRQVSDLPDRIIAATALCVGLPRISRDRKIQHAGIETIW